VYNDFVGQDCSFLHYIAERQEIAMKIDVSRFNSVITIVYENLSTKNLCVWVCADKQAFLEAMEELDQMDHIRVLKTEDSHVCWSKRPSKKTTV
jgi:hypothetical protein